nr:TatD family hydrolase [Shimwellia pseudoproteus]
MHFVDTHCHFDFPPFAHHEAESLALAAAAGVRHIIVPAISAARFPAVLDLAHRFNGLYGALGLHPLWVAEHRDEHLTQLEQQLARRDPAIVAIGEIGLDLYMDTPQFTRQEALLDSQLQLAKHYDLPVILHSRRTHDKLAMHLRRHHLARTGVVHGFAGSYQQAKQFVDLGYKIGVGGTITYPRATKSRDVIARLPVDALLLETDAPDMPLNGWQGQPNRPERVAEVFWILCSLRPEAPPVLAEHILQNSMRLFMLPEA